MATNYDFLLSSCDNDELIKLYTSRVSVNIKNYASLIASDYVNSTTQRVPTSEDHLHVILYHCKNDPAWPYVYNNKMSKEFVFSQLDKVENIFSQYLLSSLPSLIGNKSFDQVTRIIDGLTYKRNTKQNYIDRYFFTNNLSWAIPTIHAIKSIVEFADSDQILEIACGLGLWAGMIEACGGNIITSDPFTSHNTSQDKCFLSNVHLLDAVTAVKTFETNVLFVCWPSYDSSYAHDALKEFKGNKLVYIGEGYSGCTADDNFHELLQREWKLVNNVQIPCWWGIHDSLNMLERIPVPVIHDEPVYIPKSEYDGDWIEVKRKERKPKPNKNQWRRNPNRK